MRYLKTYEDSRYSSYASNAILEYGLLSLGFIEIDKDEFQLKLDEEYNVNVVKVMSHYESFLRSPYDDINIYNISNISSDSVISLVKKSIDISKTIVEYENTGKEIDNNEDLQDILTNFFDKGYAFVSKRYGFLNDCSNKEIFTYIPGIPISQEWKYVVGVKIMENQSDDTIEKDFSIFNSYLKMIGLKTKFLKDQNKHMRIFINKI